MKKPIKKVRVESLEEVLADIYDKNEKSYEEALKNHEYSVANERAYATAILNSILRRTGTQLYFPKK